MAQVSQLRRSQTDFEHLRFLGSGAFGEVHMCRNRIDGQLYALKKIRVDDSRREKVLREARLLSSLTHQRIVRYYQCWIETVEEDASDDSHRSSSTNPSSDAQTPTILDAPDRQIADTPPLQAAPPLIHGTPPTATPVVPRLVCNICSKSYLDWSVAFSAWSALDASLQPLNLCTDCYKLALINLGFDLSRISITYKEIEGGTGTDGAGAGEKGTAGATPGGAGDGTTPVGTVPPALAPAPPPPKRTVVASYLYIQTEFCERTLLEECVEIVKRYAPEGPRDVTSPGNSSNSSSGSSSASAAGQALVIAPLAMARIWQLFWEIVEGLAYLHGANVVHRDLKPSNIFSKAGCAKIGDLGLATTISTSTPTGVGLTPLGGSTESLQGAGGFTPGGAASDKQADTEASQLPAHEREGAGLGHPGGMGLHINGGRHGGLTVTAGTVAGAAAAGASSSAGTNGASNQAQGPPPSPASPAISVAGGRSRQTLGVVEEAEGEGEGSDEERPATRRHAGGAGVAGAGSPTGTAAHKTSPPLQPPSTPSSPLTAVRGAPHGLHVQHSSDGAPPGGGGDRTAGGRHRAGTAGGGGGLSQGVGTYYYMAPESLSYRQQQQSSTPSSKIAQYSEKSDLYALGVILFEMFNAQKIALASPNERAKMLGALKRGAVPRSFMETFPVQTQLISNLMQADPRARPTASDLLRYRYFVWSPAMVQAGLPVDVSAADEAEEQEAQNNGGESERAGPGRAGSSGIASGRAPMSPSKASRFLHMSLPEGSRREGLADGGAAGGNGQGAGRIGQEMHSQAGSSPSPISAMGVDMRTADTGTLRHLLGQALTTINEQSTTIAQLKAHLAQTQAYIGQLRGQVAVLSAAAANNQAAAARLYGPSSPAPLSPAGVRGMGPASSALLPSASPYMTPLLAGPQAGGPPAFSLEPVAGGPSAMHGGREGRQAMAGTRHGPGGGYALSPALTGMGGMQVGTPGARPSSSLAQLGGYGSLLAAHSPKVGVQLAGKLV